MGLLMLNNLNFTTQDTLHFDQKIRQNYQVLEISKNKEYEKPSPRIYQGASLEELKFQTEVAIEKDKKIDFRITAMVIRS